MRRFWLVIVILVIGGYGYWALNKPLPSLKPVSVVDTLPVPPSDVLTWPSYGEAAVGAEGYGLLASNGEQKPLPVASTAKIMAALAVLQKKPLKPGEQGPTFTIGDADIDFYNQYVAKLGSVVPVNYGEQLSEYQALQALLIPSGNNIAESLANWVFGSVTNYTDYANAYAKQLGLKNTHFADASGFSPATVSTAADLVTLATKAMQDPVFAQIVSQAQADVPVAGTVYNVNSQLGQAGINGIKTGNTDQAGGVYLASATYNLTGGHSVTVITAIVGASDLDTAMHDSLPLLDSARNNFAESTVIKKGQAVGYYNTPWGTSANIVATTDLEAFGWKGTKVHPDVVFRTLHTPTSKGQSVGTVSIKGRDGKTFSTPAILQQPLTPPSWQWRLLHP